MYGTKSPGSSVFSYTGIGCITAVYDLTLGFLNVDGLVVRRNIQRAQMDLELDVDYLLTLSVDSTPALIDYYGSPNLDPALKDQIGIIRNT